MLLYVSDIIFAVLIVSDIFAGYIRKIGKPVKKRLAINTSSCTMKYRILIIASTGTKRFAFINNTKLILSSSTIYY